MSPRTALLAGATGLVGRFCLQALLSDPAYGQVVVLTRRPLPSQSGDARLLQKVTDFENPEALDLPHIDDVFCALGTTIAKAGSQPAFRRIDHELPLAVAKLGLKCGAQQYVLVSSVGADAASKNFYLRTKGETEQELNALPYQAIHIFQPSLLVGTRDERRIGEVLGIAISKVFQFLLIGRLRRYHPIAASVVGSAMVAAARGHAQLSRKIYEYAEIVRLASSVG